MINLLPKQDIRRLLFARANRIILHYTVATLIFAVIFIGAILSNMFFLQALEKEIEDDITKKQAAIAKISDVKKEISEFKNDLSVSKKLLDQRITYSLVMIRIGNIIPYDMIIKPVTVNAQSFDTSFKFEIETVSVNKVLELKKELEKSEYFSDVKIESIRQQNKETQSEGETPSKYTHSATISTIMSKSIQEPEKEVDDVKKDE